MGGAKQRLRRSGALLTVLGVMASTVGLFAGPSDAVVVSPGTLGGFESDGNLVEEPATSGDLDWDVIDGAALVLPDEADPDNGFTGGSKENDPSTWVCDPDSGDAPPKDNIRRAYVSTRIGDGEGFLDLAWVRDKGTGSANIVYEFSQVPQSAASCTMVRTAGDLRVFYDFDGVTESTAITAFLWNGTGWVDQGLTTDDAKGKTSLVAVTDPLNGDEGLAARTFGETTIDLTAFLPSSGDECVSFGSVSLRSRSSGSSEESELHDRVSPAPVDLSTCGGVRVKKVDDSDPAQPLEGAVFGLFDNPDASGDPIATCTTGADGTCLIDGVNPGDYWVKEIQAPAGHDPSGDIVPITIDFLEIVDLTTDPFVNPRQRGDLIIEKTTVGSTGSFTFDVECSAGTSAGDIPISTESTNPNTATGATGLVVGTECKVTEDDPGAKWATDPSSRSVDVVIEEGKNIVRFTNRYIPDLAILLAKSGPAQAHAGDVVTYSFSVTNVGEAPLEDVVVSDPKCDVSGPTLVDDGDGDGDAVLAVSEVWEYTCQGTIPLDAADPYPNTATVTAVDEEDNEVTDSDNHEIDLISAAIHVEKTGPALAHVGDEVTFDIAVTNPGDDPVENVTVGDLDDACDAVLESLGGDTDSDGRLDPGETWAYRCVRFITADDPDPFTNVVEVGGEDELGRPVSDDDDHPVDLIHPAIEVVKTASPDEIDGTSAEVTYTYEVTNTGDVTLTDVTVVDDVLGPIGTIPSLAPEETVVLTKTVTMTSDGPLRNVATATGTDPLERDVSDDDDAVITFVEPLEETTTTTTPPTTTAAPTTTTTTAPIKVLGEPPLARTGAASDRLLVIGGFLIVIGGLAMALGEPERRRRPHTP